MVRRIVIECDVCGEEVECSLTVCDNESGAHWDLCSWECVAALAESEIQTVGQRVIGALRQVAE
jgi:hypothetical protein